MPLSFSCVKKFFSPQYMGVFQNWGKFFSKNFQLPPVVWKRNL